MNNITKALVYLLIIFLMLTGAGFMYHKQIEKQTPTPTPTDNTQQQTQQEDNTPLTEDLVFVRQAQEIFQNAIAQWQNDSANGQIEFTYCNVEGCAAGAGGSYGAYQYNITVNSGSVKKYYVTNGVYQFSYVGDGLFVENITNPARVADVDPSVVITITPNM